VDMATSRAADTEFRKDEFPNIALPIFDDAFREEAVRIRSQVLGPGIDPDPCTQDVKDYSVDTVLDNTWARRNNYADGSPEHLRLSLCNLNKGGDDKLLLGVEFARQEQLDFAALISGVQVR
jgi:hypothetical protein